MGPEKDGVRIPEGRGTLYKLNDTSCFEKLDPVVTGVTISNGLAWNEDGTKMYYIDSAARNVAIFDYNPATASAGSVHFDFSNKCTNKSCSRAENR